jgi:hypothetical protein
MQVKPGVTSVVMALPTSSARAVIIESAAPVIVENFEDRDACSEAWEADREASRDENDADIEEPRLEKDCWKEE